MDMDVTPRRIVIWMHISLFSKKKSEKPPSISSVPDPSQRMPHHAGRSGDDRTRVVHSIMGILNYRKTMTHSFASYVVTGPEIAGDRCQSCAVQASISSRTCITTFQTLHPVSRRQHCADHFASGASTPVTGAWGRTRCCGCHPLLSRPSRER